jgi:hypothetical protein
MKSYMGFCTLRRRTVIDVQTKKNLSYLSAAVRGPALHSATEQASLCWCQCCVRVRGWLLRIVGACNGISMRSDDLMSGLRIRPSSWCLALTALQPEITSFLQSVHSVTICDDIVNQRMARATPNYSRSKMKSLRVRSDPWSVVR